MKVEAERVKVEAEKVPEVIEEVPVSEPTAREPEVLEELPAAGVKGLTAKLQSKLADFKERVDKYDKEATKKRVLKIWNLIRELGEENRKEHRKFFEEYKEYLKEGEKKTVTTETTEAVPAKITDKAAPTPQEEKVQISI